MTIDDNLIESLLYEGEGIELDLKSDQYRFTKANDDEKSELLKDILAFANAWRRSDAFILIGAQEVKGGRSQVLGISDLLDDASVQQFVNSKTNRPVIFSYRTLSFEGKKIAIIHIPIQQRPIYLKKDFGKLKGETVYVKRGSSTAIASIDEIAKMGLQPLLEHGEPDLEVFFAAPKTRSRLPNEIELKPLVLETPESSSIPDYSRRQRDPFDIRTSHPNYSYYRDLVKYTKVSRLVFPLHVAVGNAGSATAHDVRLELKVDKSAGNVIIMDSYRYPDIPRKEYNVFDLSPKVTNATTRYDVEVDDVGNFWIVEARAHKVQPKGIHWFRDPFYVGSLVSCNIPIAVTIFSDQLQIPKQKQLFVKVQSEQRKVDLEGIKQLERERILASPEYQRLIQKQK
jgi:hypothetical protein